MQNFEHYDMLVGDESVHRKVQKLGHAAKSRGTSLGTELLKRLNYFDRSCREKRNNLSHGKLVDRKFHIDFKSVGKMGDVSTYSVRPRNLDTKQISYNDAFKHVFWMSDFCADLRKLAPKTWRKRLPKVIDIARPHCHLPPVDPNDRKGELSSQSKDRKPQKSPGAKPQAKQPKP